MQTGQGQLVELILQDGFHSARISCSGNLIPSPGQYLLAGNDSATHLPVALFYTDSAPSGFIAALPLPDSWNPGRQLHLRGPLGRGFGLPNSARRVALVAYDDMPARLRGLIRLALKQDAAVVLVCDSASESLPDEVEVQPSSALLEVGEWADYIALDIAHENLSELRQRLGKLKQVATLKEVQVLIRTLMPCGGIAECGVCAVTIKSNWRMVCKDGPVFDWGDLRE
jgi:NAD(P)H-flavin reductase